MAQNGTVPNNVPPTWPALYPRILQHPLTIIMWLPAHDAGIAGINNATISKKLYVVHPNGSRIDLHHCYSFAGQIFLWDIVKMIKLLHIQDIIWIFRARPDLGSPNVIQTLTLGALIAASARVMSFRDQAKDLYTQINGLNIIAKSKENEIAKQLDAYCEEILELQWQLCSESAANQSKDILTESDSDDGSDDDSVAAGIEDDAQYGYNEAPAQLSPELATPRGSVEVEDAIIHIELHIWDGSDLSAASFKQPNVFLSPKTRSITGYDDLRAKIRSLAALQGVDFGACFVTIPDLDVDNDNKDSFVRLNRADYKAFMKKLQLHVEKCGKESVASLMKVYVNGNGSPSNQKIGELGKYLGIVGDFED